MSGGGTVLLQAAGFSLLAAISPTALLVMAVWLGSANPRRMAVLYVAGAVIMTVAMAVAVLVVIRFTGLNLPRRHDPRYGVRLGLGVLALAGVAIVLARKRSQPDEGKQREGFVDRLISQPSPHTAFASGVLLFAPGATFIAAVQVVATSDASVPVIVVALALVVAITALVVWLPLVGYLTAPDATTRRLAALNRWLRTHGRTVVIYALGVAGAVLVVDGALGLSGVY
ncbi:MAG TPA: GAP family protein [Trebonia sp.]|nr:GAP family protein [Trebonia sp.]